MKIKSKASGGSDCLGGTQSMTFRFREFCQFLEGFGFGEFGLELKVSVSASENLVSDTKSRFRSRLLTLLPNFGRFQFRRIWSRIKSLGFGFGKFGFGYKVSVSV